MCKLICFIAFIELLYCYRSYAQDKNYLQESVRIEKITGKVSVRIKFNVVNGVPVPVPENKAVFNTLVEKLTTAYQGKNKVDRGTGEGGETEGEAPTVGASEQPNRPNNGVIADTKPDQYEDIKREITNELAYVLFIAGTNSAESLKKIIATCPRRFYYLESIEKNINLLQSTSGTTNFAFPEAQIIYGIVDFTITRAKEQLIEIYLSGWYDKLNGNSFSREMLPQTLGTLKAFNDDESLNVAQYGDKWKSAFQEDFRNFPILFQKESFVNKLLDAVGIKDREKTETGAVITGGSQLMHGLYLKKHLVTTLSDMSVDYIAEGGNDPAAFKRLTVFSDILLKAGGTLKNNDSYEAVTVDDIGRMDYTSWRIFLKLLFVRHYQALQYASCQNITDLLPKLLENEKIDRFAQLYRQTINVATTYQKAVSAGANMTAAELNFEETRKLFELGFQLAGQAVSYLPYITKDDSVSQETALVLQTAGQYYRALSQIGEGVSSRRYGAVVDGTAGIMRMLDKNEKLGSLVNNIQRYGSFMVNIINAKDGGEVKSALDELIPKNSYKLKNTHSFTVSLSSYPGFFAGFERISKFQVSAEGQPQTSLNKESSWAFAPAVFLPVGIDLNFGNKKKDHHEKYNSTNLFFQILDIGAVLNYRVTESGSSEDPDPNITFKQILSPGFGLIWHFNNSPLVAGTTMSYTPSLRKINQAGNEYNSNALRFGLFVAIDVTYFNLFTSKKVVK